MKIALIFLLPCLVAAKPSGTAIKVLGSRTFDDIPNIDITFPDGHQDTFVLERHYMSEADRLAKKMHCNFIGHLAKDTDACVAVTGCIGERMEFTINSEHAGESNKFILHANGELEPVESPFKGMEAFAEELRIPQQMRDDEWELVDGDEFENAEQMAGEMQWEANCAAGQCTALPETNLMRVKVGYDDTFNTDLGSAAAAATYLDSMFTHVQTFFCHSTLGSKIKIERDGDYTHHSGNTWKAEPDFGSLDGPIMQITSSSSSNAHLFVYMCKDPAFYGTIGLAWVGTLCGPNSWKGYKASINEKRQNAVATAEVVAHEMGHNMGMSHDFADKHGGQSGACNGQGLMSYGSVPQKWSTCSQADYLARYNQVGGNNWCMAAAPTACGGGSPAPPTTAAPTTAAPTTAAPTTAAPTTAAPTTAAPTTAGPTTAAPTTPAPTDCAAMAQNPSWYQDRYCDDEFNTPECNYDGGDCCVKKTNNWHDYCTECECKGLDCSSQIKKAWGNGRRCNGKWNNAGCFYDGGDCCKNPSSGKCRDDLAKAKAAAAAGF